jgi:hypothetical protein
MAKTIENGDYKIEYRLPSITEGMRLLGGSGIDPSNPDVAGAKGLIFMADMIDQSEKFVEKIELKGKPVIWSDCLMDQGFSGAVTELATALMNSFGNAETEQRKKS